MEQLCDTPDVLRHILSFICPHQLFDNHSESNIRSFNGSKQEINNALHFSYSSKKIYHFLTSQTLFKDKNLLTLYIKKELPLIYDVITKDEATLTFEMQFIDYFLNEKNKLCLKYKITIEQAESNIDQNFFENILNSTSRFTEYFTTYITEAASDKKDKLNAWLQYFKKASYSTFLRKTTCTQLYNNTLVLHSIFSIKRPLSYALFLKFTELPSITRQ
jgi:hypothetical protein